MVYSADAVGLDGALGRLAHEPYGPYLLGAVAAGFFAFAVFSSARPATGESE